MRFRSLTFMICVTFAWSFGCDDAAKVANTSTSPKGTTQAKGKAPDFKETAPKVAPKTPDDTQTPPKTLKLTQAQLDERLKQAYANMSDQEKALYVTCMKEKGAVCLALGRLYEKKARAFKADKEKRDDAWRKALVAFKRGCKSNDMASCVALGDMYANGEAFEKQDAVASFVYKKACDRKHDPGCVRLARMQKEGRAGSIKASVDVLKAENKACDKGNVKACARLGSRYEDGLNVAKNPTLALVYFERACELDHPLSCHAVGVKMMKLTKKDKRALQLFEKACTLKFAQSCFNAAYLLQNNRGGKRDVSKMKVLLKNACDGGYKPGCQKLAQLSKLK